MRVSRAMQTFAVVVLMLVVASVAQRKDDIAWKNQGSYLQAVPGASVRVCTNTATGTPCTPLATVYTDGTLSVTASATFAADANGNYHFYAAPGNYQVQVTDASTAVTLTMVDVNIPPSTASINTWTAAQSFQGATFSAGYPFAINAATWTLPSTPFTATATTALATSSGQENIVHNFVSNATGASDGSSKADVWTFTGNLTGTNAVDTYIGGRFRAVCGLTTAAITGTCRAQSNEANSTGSGNVAELMGVGSRMGITGSGNVTTQAIGFHGLVPSFGSTGTTPNLYQFYADDPGHAFDATYNGRMTVGAIAFGTGDITTNAPLNAAFLSAVTARAGAYESYHNGGAASYFKGQVGFGNSSEARVISGTTAALVVRGPAIDLGGINAGDYGGVMYHSTSAQTSGARRFLLTNAYGGNKFAVIRSVDATTDPAIDSSGTVTSGTVDFSIDNTGLVTIPSLGGTVATATNATNTAITDDTSTVATMYPTWVTANTGNLPQKTTSTKLTFNPSTGALSSTVLSTTNGQTALTIQGLHATFAAPAAASTYYFGMTTNSLTATNGVSRIYVPRTGTITRCDFFIRVAGTLGTAAQVVTYVIRKNDTTDSSSATKDWSVANQTLTLSPAFAVVAGDFIEFKLTTPGTWTTPATNVYHSVTCLMTY